MNEKLYLEKRDGLTNDMKKALDAGDLEKAKAIRQSIIDLDSAQDAYNKELANANALGEPIIAKAAAPLAAPLINLNGAPTADSKAKLYERAFAKFMLKRSLDDEETAVFDEINSAKDTMTTETNSVLVPKTMLSGIWKEMEEAHPILSELAKTFVQGNIDILMETDSGDAAEFYDEATAVKDGTTSFGTLSLTGYELSRAIPVSWKLKIMSVEDFLPYITVNIAEKMGEGLATAVISGKGVPAAGDKSFKAQPKGIITSLEAESGTPQIITYTGDLTYKNITAFMSKLKPGYLNGSFIYANNDTIWNQLANILDGTGRPIFVPDPTGKFVGRIFGEGVLEEAGIPAGGILLGNVRKAYAINVNKDVSMYYEDHIKDRYTDYMGYAIVDGNTKTTKAFSYLKKSA